MFRDMDWLDEKRARIYCAAAAIALLGAFAQMLLGLHHGYDAHGDLLGGDYSSFWAASRLILLGRPADVYVPALHHLAELPVLRNSYSAFYYPPTYLVLCLPLALTAFFPSLLLFLGTTGAAFAAVLWRILRAPWSFVAVLAFPAVYIDIMPGQNAFLTAAILGCGLGLLGRRPGVAGAILGLMVLKPHLALAVPVALLVSRRWQTLICAAASALGLVAISYALFGWGTWAAFLANAHEARETLEQGTVGFDKMQSTFALARLLGASVPAAYALHSLTALTAISALIWAQRQQTGAAAERALIVIACLLITPFSLFYDMVILALPLAWMLCEWRLHGFPPWSKLLLCAVLLAPAVHLFCGPGPFALPILLVFGAYILRRVPITRNAPAFSWHGASA
ncbi:MAG TPA: glycosyltransferase family 87 protein [Acetobacteraceae bacterium]